MKSEQTANDIDGLTIGEIAQLKAMPKSTVAWTIRHSVRRLWRDRARELLRAKKEERRWQSRSK